MPFHDYFTGWHIWQLYPKKSNIFYRGCQLPETRRQWQEVLREQQWQWKHKGYILWWWWNHSTAVCVWEKVLTMLRKRRYPSSTSVSSHKYELNKDFVCAISKINILITKFGVTNFYVRAPAARRWNKYFLINNYVP